MGIESLSVEYVPSGPSWLVPGAILLSALLATFIALLAVAQQRLVAKKKAAQDYILELWTERHSENEKTFLDLHENDQLSRVIEAKTSTQIKEKLQVRHYLNHFEMLALAIKKNIIDERVCKLAIIDQVISANEKGRVLIDKIIEINDGDDDFYCHLKELAEKWQADPTVPDEKFWLLEILREIPRI